MKRVMSMCSGRLRGRSRNAVIPLYGIVRMDIYTISRSVCVEYKKKRCTDKPYSDSSHGNDFGDGKVKVWC